MGPCMCGAIDCPSCGPAQGATRCEEHDRLACDDCIPCEKCGEILTNDDGPELCIHCELDREEDE